MKSEHLHPFNGFQTGIFQQLPNKKYLATTMEMSTYRVSTNSCQARELVRILIGSRYQGGIRQKRIHEEQPPREGSLRKAKRNEETRQAYMRGQGRDSAEVLDAEIHSRQNDHLAR